MKSLMLFFIFSFAFTNFDIFAQDADSQNDNHVVFKVVDRRNRPVRDIFVESLNSGQSGMTKRDGMFLFVNIDDTDVISVTLPRRQGNVHIPVEGMAVIELELLSVRTFAYTDGEGQRVTLLPIANSTNTSSVIDINTIEILKDGAGYGTRGAGGVILIKTR